MTIYLYRCEDGHEAELDYPMGQAPASAGPCPTVVTVGVTDAPVLCGKPLNRAFSVPYIVHGHGFVNYAPWAGKVQKSKEAQERFGKSGVPV